MPERIIHFSSGESIIKCGAQEKRMYIILKGEVEISLNEGMKKVILTRLKKHDFFGEISLFNDIPRSADAIALGSTKLTYLNTMSELNEFLEKNPGFAKKMVGILANRLAKTDELLLKELSGRSRAAVIGFLW